MSDNRDRSEQIKRNNAWEYPEICELMDDFVNKGITQGHALNMLVFGDTLYIDEGNNGTKLFYYQLAIRTSEDLFFVNMRDKHTMEFYHILDLLEKHISAWNIKIHLPTVHQKRKRGVVEPAMLGMMLIGEPTGKVKTAIKNYARESIRYAEIENFRKLYNAHEDLKPLSENPLWLIKEGGYYVEIEDTIDQIKAARKTLEKIDNYLNILKQYPERPR